MLITIAIVSCGHNKSLSSFSKRKYFDKSPKQNNPYQESKEKEHVYASTDFEPKNKSLEKYYDIDYKTKISLEDSTNHYPDTILKKNGEVIICNITLVNEDNIFYEYKKKKRLKSTYVNLSEVEKHTSSNIQLVSVNNDDIQNNSNPKKANPLQTVAIVLLVVLGLIVVFTIIIAMALAGNI